MPVSVLLPSSALRDPSSVNSDSGLGTYLVWGSVHELRHKDCRHAAPPTIVNATARAGLPGRVHNAEQVSLLAATHTHTYICIHLLLLSSRAPVILLSSTRLSHLSCFLSAESYAYPRAYQTPPGASLAALCTSIALARTSFFWALYTSPPSWSQGSRSSHACPPRRHRAPTRYLTLQHQSTATRFPRARTASTPQTSAHHPPST